MAELGLAPKNKFEQEFWRNLLREVDADGTNSFSFAEYLHFVAEAPPQRAGRFACRSVSGRS